ncbi:MAG: methyltransferase domain-containing protein [Eubacteriales bacterium]|nr:methyltransferase domain-containing protein [Eubacteriales bacterium]
MENGLRIRVDKPSFSYGGDAVALADFARLKKGERALDLGAGTGILSILLHGRYGARFIAIEVQEAMCALARESVALNNQEDAIEVRCADLRALRPCAGFENFDAAVCNPPYFCAGTQSENGQRMQSRHQNTCTLRDVAACAARMLKDGGRLYVCCPVSQFADCCAALIQYGLQPKRACIQNQRLVLLEARKNGGVGLELTIENQK